MALETYIDVVYRSPIISAGTPMNKTLCDVVVDGVDYIGATEGTSNPCTVIVRSFNNASPSRITFDAAATVTYTDIITRSHAVMHPMVHGKSFIIELQYGVANDSDPKAWLGLFGNIFTRIASYGRQAAGS